MIYSCFWGYTFNPGCIFWKQNISPKNTPTATTWWVVFCGLDFYGWDMSTIHAASTPGGDREIKVKRSWRNWSNSHLRQNPRETLRRMYSTVWDSKEPFGRQKPFAAKKQKTHVSFCPKTFTMWLKTPKANSVGEKCEKELKEMGDKCKEVMGEPSAEPFRKRKGSAPEDQRHHETCATFVNPWWNLGGTLAEP